MTTTFTSSGKLFLVWFLMCSDHVTTDELIEINLIFNPYNEKQKYQKNQSISISLKRNKN